MDHNPDSNQNPNPGSGQHYKFEGAVRSFRDALGLVMSLSDDYAFVSAAVLLSDDRSILGVIMSDGIGRSIGPLVSRVCDAVDQEAPLDFAAGSDFGAANPACNRMVTAVSVLLLTVRPFEVDIIRETDLELFRRACWTISTAGAELIDWIETDGDLFRSYAYVTCPGVAWPDDPPGERLDRLSAN